MFENLIAKTLKYCRMFIIFAFGYGFENFDRALKKIMAQKNFKTYFRTLQIIHFGLLGGQLLMTGVFAFSVHYHLVETDVNFPTNYIYLTLLLPVLGVLGSNFLFKTFLQRIDDKATIREKLTSYQTALLARYAVLEAPTLMLLVLYFLCGNKFLILAALLAAAYFLMMKPSEIGLIEDLELNQEQQKQMYEM